MGEVIELTKQALWLTLVLSAPPVGAAALVGLLVAFLQAATPLQEQTFAYTLTFFTLAVTLFITAALSAASPYTSATANFPCFQHKLPHLHRASPPLPPTPTH